MTDLSQPATAAEFVAAGASAADAAILAEQHNAMAGHRGADARAALSIAARDQPPPTAPPPAASPVTQAQAVSALEAHEAALLDGEMAKLFAGGRHDYPFPPPRDGVVTDEDMARDSGIKAVFRDEGFPDWLGKNIVNELVAGEHALSRMTPQQAEARVASTVGSLKGMWGADYDSNLATVDKLLEQIARRHPTLGIDGSVRLDDRDVPLLELLDSLTVNSLLEFAKNRASRR